jgi:mRNA-degrading endonuclease toxin of MazEF toxin-antitoxin module
VLTRNEAVDYLNEVFVVLATTNIRGLPTEVELGPADRMPRDCHLVTRLISLDKAEVAGSSPASPMVTEG